MIDRPARLKAFARSAYPRFIEELGMLVEIESETGDVEGSAAIAALLVDRLTALGAAVETHVNGRGTHVVGRFRGDGHGRFLLLMHTDTVHPRGSLARQPFRVDADGRAYGPGAGDSKASAVFALHLAEALVTVAGRPYGELVLYFDSEEEGGSDDEVGLVRGLASAADVAIILDTARPGWGIVTRRKGLASYRFEAHGIPGHAGNAAHATASATGALVRVLAAVQALAGEPPGDPRDFGRDALASRGIVDHGQFIPDVSVNIGVIGSDNTKTNVVAAHAWAEIEVRAWSQADLERVDREIRAIAETSAPAGARVAVAGGIGYPPMEKDGRAAAIVARYAAIVRDTYGAEVVEWSAGGVTVGNFTAELAPTIDALAVEMAFEHDLAREYADLTTFEPRLVAAAMLIAGGC